MMTCHPVSRCISPTSTAAGRPAFILSRVGIGSSTDGATGVFTFSGLMPDRFQGQRTAGAPDAKPAVRSGRAALSKFIIHWPRQTPFQSGTDADVGFRILAPARLPHHQFMRVTKRDFIPDIAAKRDYLRLANAVKAGRNHDEWHVIDRNPATLDRRYEPITSVGLTAQYAGEQLHQSRPANESAFMIPASIGRDPDVEVLRRRTLHSTKRGFLIAGRNVS